jgi:hypothetical protein
MSNRRNCIARLVLASAVHVFAGPAWAGDKVLEKALLGTPPLRVPIEVRRPVDDVLRQFGLMEAAYRLPMGNSEITIAINPLGNISGNDKFPYDVSRYASDVFSKMRVFRTFTSLPDGAALRDNSGVALSQLLNARETPPQPSFRLVGGIVNAEPVVVRETGGRLDAQFGGKHAMTNGGATGKRGGMLTALTISLSLQHPNSVEVEGASVRYRIIIEETDDSKGVQAAFLGNGFGFSASRKITQDSSFAIYDAMALALIHIMGNALRIPYFQCDNRLGYDTALENQVSQDFSKLTELELEDKLQRFMIVDGFNIGRQPVPLKPADRRVLNDELTKRALTADRRGMVRLAMQFWLSMRYLDGANRMAEINVNNILAKRQREEQETVQRAPLPVDPREFGFAPGTNIVVIDLSRVGRPDVLKQISSVIRSCWSCGEVRWHPQKPLVGIHTTMKEAQIQYLISSTRVPFEYVWSHVQTPRLLIVPVAGTGR